MPTQAGEPDRTHDGNPEREPIDFSELLARWPLLKVIEEMGSSRQAEIQRRTQALRWFIVAVCWLAFVCTCIGLNGAGVWHHSDPVLIALCTTGTGGIIGTSYIVLKGIFVA